MRLIFQDYVFYLFLGILIGLGIWEVVRYYKSSNVNCYFCKRRGMWYKWKDRDGLPQPICNKPDCIERALEERMTAVWA